MEDSGNIFVINVFHLFRQSLTAQHTPLAHLHHQRQASAGTNNHREYSICRITSLFCGSTKKKKIEVKVHSHTHTHTPSCLLIFLKVSPTVSVVEESSGTNTRWKAFEEDPVKKFHRCNICSILFLLAFGDFDSLRNPLPATSPTHTHTQPNRTPTWNVGQG